MDLLNSSLLSGIIGICLLLLIVAAIIRTRANTPEHYDRVLEKARLRDTAGDRAAALKQLQAAVQKLEHAQKRSSELDAQLGKLKFAYGKMLAADRSQEAALKQLRAVAAMRGAEQAVIDTAVVAILEMRTADAQDVRYFIALAERAAGALKSDHPFVLALSEEHFRRMFQDASLRADTAKLSNVLYAKGISFPWLMRAHAHASAQSGDEAQAVVLLKKIVTAKQAVHEDHRLLARLLTEKGELQAALDIHTLVTQDAGANAADFRAAGLAALQLHETTKNPAASVLETAATWLGNATDRESGHAPTWAALGRVRRLQNKNDLARIAYARALQNAEGDAPTHTALADVLIDLKLPAQALPHLVRAAELTRTNGELWLRCGTLAVELSDDATAIRCLEQSVACKPVIRAAVLSLAEVMHRHGRHSRIIELLDPLTDLPTEMLPMLWRALALAGRNADAIQRLHTYLRSADAHPRARFELGMLYGRTRNWKMAAAQFDGLSDAQLQITVLPHHAYVCLQNQEFARAAQLVKKARTNKLRTALLHHVAATLANANQEFAKAHEEWSSALQLDPALTPALHGFARFCEARQDYAAAVQLYRTLQTLEPKRQDVTVRIGICHIRAGNFALGVQALESAGTELETLDGTAVHEEALECLTYGYVKLKQWTQADAAQAQLPNRARRAAYSHRNAYIVGYHLAQEAYAAGNYERSVSLLENLASQQTDQSATTRSLYAAQTALVSTLLPPSPVQEKRTQLRTELQRLTQIAPATFIARVLPALLNAHVGLSSAASSAANSTIHWKSFSDVRPVDWAQTLALALLAITADQRAEAARLLGGIDENRIPGGRPWQLPYLRGLTALHAQKWSAAFEQLRLCILATNKPDDEHMPMILRSAIAAAARVERADEALDLLNALKHSSPDKHYLLGVLLLIKGDISAAQAALAAAGPRVQGAPEAIRAIALATVRAAASAGNWAAALEAIAAAPNELLTQPDMLAARLDLQLRKLETDAGTAPPRSLTTFLRTITPDLLLQPRFLRRASILATRAVLTDKGSASDLRDGYRLSAALWATALESDYVWKALDTMRIGQGLSALPQEKHAELSEAARQKLLTTIRARSTSGWSRDDVDLISAWVDYEFACSALFAKSGIGFALDGWVKGLAAAPYLLMKDDGQLHAAIMLRNARESIVTALARFGPQPNPAPAGVHRLGIYLQPIVGFAEYLLDTNRPALALLHLDASKDSSEAAQRVRARAIAAQAAVLSTSDAGAKDSLRMFEQAASLKADLSDKRQDIVRAAVAMSRNMLTSQPGQPDAALQPIETARRLAGNHTDLNAATAAVYVQQAIQLQHSKKLEAAEQKFRAALNLSNDKPTRDLFAGLLAKRANEVLFKRQLDQALNLMRESLHTEGVVDASDIDYRARCDLQQELINTGIAIAADDDAGINQCEISLTMGLDAQRILDDEDARNYLGAIHRELGRLHANRKNWDRAIDHLEKAVGYRNSEDYRKMLARYLLIRGATSWDAGYRTSGARDINKAYSLDPSNPDIRRAWSMVP
jgi:Tfp pilus assembly protein PilF